MTTDRVYIRQRAMARLVRDVHEGMVAHVRAVLVHPARLQLALLDPQVARELPQGWQPPGVLPACRIAVSPPAS